MPVPLPTRLHLLAAEEVPPGPDVVLDRSGSSRAVADRLADPAPAAPHAVLVRVGELNSPDAVASSSAQQLDDRVVVEVLVRRYSGPLFANLVRLGVVEVGPVPLPAGPLVVELVLRTEEVTTPHGEEPAGPGATDRHQWVVPVPAAGGAAGGQEGPG